MSMNKEQKSSWIRLLGEIISDEVTKKDGHTDMELVNKCSEIIDQLMGDDYNSTEDEIKEIIAQITSADRSSESAVESRPRRNLRKIFVRLAAVVLSAVVLMGVGVSAACLIDPMILEGIRTVISGNEGEKVKKENITYINEGVLKSYETIDEFLDDMSLDILFFRDLPEDIIIKEIISSGNNIFPLNIVFDDKRINFCILKSDVSIEEKTDNNSELFKTGEYSYIIKYIDNNYFGVLSHNGYLYQSVSLEKDLIISLFEYLK